MSRLRLSTRHIMAVLAGLGWIGLAVERAFHDPDRRWLLHEWVERDDPGMGPPRLRTDACRADPWPAFLVELLGFVPHGLALCDHDRTNLDAFGNPSRTYQRLSTPLLAPDESWWVRATLSSLKTLGTDAPPGPSQ